MAAKTPQERLFTIPPVDGYTADGVTTKLVGRGEGICRPLRYQDGVLLLVRGHVDQVGITTKETKDGTDYVRTATVRADHVYLLDHYNGLGVDDTTMQAIKDALPGAVKSHGLLGLIDVAAAAAARERAIRDGVEPLPFDLYLEEQTRDRVTPDED